MLFFFLVDNVKKKFDDSIDNDKSNHAVVDVRGFLSFISHLSLYKVFLGKITQIVNVI